MVDNRMKKRIETDPRGYSAVVDEDSRGTKAIPAVIVTKGANGFTYGGTPVGDVTNRMNKAIESDTAGHAQVVDEDINGIKAVPLVIVEKDENGAFVYGSISGGGEGQVGPVGPAGPKGDTGATGARGATGATGPAGAQGIQGVAGPKGDKGDTGAVGPAGPKGDAGTAGAPGAQGVAGPAGPRGDTGAVGPAGTAGAKGDKGDKGDTGAAGPAGFGTKAQYDDIIARLIALES